MWNAILITIKMPINHHKFKRSPEIKLIWFCVPQGRLGTAILISYSLGGSVSSCQFLKMFHRKNSACIEKNMSKQESPTWTQEAHRPPRNKCSLCWSVSRPGGGGGTPIESRLGGGTPIQSWWWYPHLGLGWGTTPPPPPSGPAMGYPPSPDRPDGLTLPPPPHTHPQSRCELTNWKEYLPLSFGCGR